jgi:heat shock protein HslJ
MRAYPLLLLLPLSLAACASTPAASSALAPQPGKTAHSATWSTTTPDAALLGSYHWQLAQAAERNGQRIGSLFVRPDRPLQLDFGGDRISVRNSCNGMGGNYRIVNGQLVVGPMMHTMMACANLMLNRLDSVIGEVLNSRPAITVTRSGGTPQLQLRTPAGDTLEFTGVPTPETRYGGPGVTEFLEVSPQTVPCNHPLVPSSQCLDVREVHYAANGLKTGTPGVWHVLPQGIEGYTQQPGVRNVLRVKRYTVKNPPADAPAVAYVLDMVVESQTTGH